MLMLGNMLLLSFVYYTLYKTAHILIITELQNLMVLRSDVADGEIEFKNKTRLTWELKFDWNFMLSSAGTKE